jgi:hypothetical protein
MHVRAILEDELGPHELHVNSSIRALATKGPGTAGTTLFGCGPAGSARAHVTANVPNRQRVSGATMVLANAELPSTARAVGAVQPF